MGQFSVHPLSHIWSSGGPVTVGLYSPHMAVCGPANLSEVQRKPSETFQWTEQEKCKAKSMSLFSWESKSHALLNAMVVRMQFCWWLVSSVLCPAAVWEYEDQLPSMISLSPLLCYCYCYCITGRKQSGEMRKYLFDLPSHQIYQVTN